jgi:hypothetical protein
MSSAARPVDSRSPGPAPGSARGASRAGGAPRVRHARRQLGDDRAGLRDGGRGQRGVRRAAQRDRGQALAGAEQPPGPVVVDAVVAQPEQRGEHAAHQHPGEVGDVQRPGGEPGARLLQAVAPRPADELRGRRLGEQVPGARAQVVVARPVEQVEDPVAQHLRPQVPDPALRDEGEGAVVGEHLPRHQRIAADPPQPRHAPDRADPAARDEQRRQGGAGGDQDAELVAVGGGQHAAIRARAVRDGARIAPARTGATRLRWGDAPG